MKEILFALALVAGCGSRSSQGSPDEAADLAAQRRFAAPIRPPQREAFQVNKELLLRDLALQPTLSAQAQQTCPIPATPTTENLTDLLACRGGDQIVIDLSLGRRIEIIRRLLKANTAAGEVLQPIRNWAQETVAADPQSTVPEAPIARLVLAYALLTANSDPDAITWARPAIGNWQADVETRLLAARMWAAALHSCTVPGAPTVCGVPAAYRDELKTHMAVARRLGHGEAEPELVAIREAIASDAQTVQALGSEAQPPSGEAPSIAQKRRRQEVRRVALSAAPDVLRAFIDPVDGLMAVGHFDSSQHGNSLVRIIMPDQLSDDTFAALKPRFEDANRAVCPPEGRTCAAPAEGSNFGTEFEFIPREGRVYLRRIVYYMGQ